MMTNGWNYFERTGDVEAYLLYREFKKLMDNEYADDFYDDEEQVEEYEPETEGFDYQGDKRRRGRQDSYGVNP